jgi:hypothetical protein
MDFSYSRNTEGAFDRRVERLLEIFPGMLSWSIIIGMLVFSFFLPLAASVIMIAFLLYWLLRLIYINIFLVFSYIRLEIEKSTDWMERLQGIDRIDSYAKELCAISQKKGWKNKFSSRLHYRQVERLKKSKTPAPLSKDIYHLVIIPVIREGREIVEPGILAIKENDYPAERMLIVIALEDSAQEEVKKEIKALQDAYRKFFLDFLVVRHPAGLPGEARVKGANVTHAAKASAQELAKLKIPHENVLVSCFDSDTIASSNYFSCLTYHFMITPDRTRASYQPVPVYHNNIWQVPGFARIIDIGASFFQLIESTNSKTLVTFSSHSMSFKALTQIGYWPLDMISDDSAVFWKAFIHYDGNYQVVPIYTTVSMDIAAGPSFIQTFANIYKQKRRWAWGVENFPIVIRAFMKSKKISLYKKISYAYKLLDSFVSWATWSILLVFGTWLPVLFATREFATSTVYYTAPRIRATIFGLASLGIVICAVISLLLLPRKKTKYPVLIRIKHALEWLLIPAVVLFLSALPALDAQTRLMTARYMEFWVTDKIRKK